MFELVFNEERYDLRQLHLLLLAVREACHPLTLDDRRAFISDAMKHGRRVADCRHRLAGVVKGFDQLDRVRIFYEVPHGTMTTGIEDAVEVLGTDFAQLLGGCKYLLRGLIGLEPRHGGRLIFRQIALWVDRRLTAFWGHECQVDACI